MLLDTDFALWRDYENEHAGWPGRYLWGPPGTLVDYHYGEGAPRALEPASKLEATRWVGRDVVIDGVPGISEDQLYRAMDFLLACSERVQESVFFSVAHLLNLEVDVIFFDSL